MSKNNSWLYANDPKKPKVTWALEQKMVPTNGETILEILRKLKKVKKGESNGSK